MSSYTRQSRLAIRFLTATLVVAVCALALHGQVKEAPGDDLRGVEMYKHGDEVTLGEIPKFFVEPQKAKAIVKNVDVEARTITVVPASAKDSFRVAELTVNGRAWSRAKEMTLTFVAPKGTEKIIASGQAAKRLGKKGLRLNEIPIDAKVELRYYPAGPAIRELTVQSVPNK